MPNRLLRDGICTSDRLNECAAEEEIMFYRLLVVADDYGYVDARPAILKALCFPLRDTATPPLIERWLCGLAGAGLVVRYRAADGKPYLAISKWEQRVRSRQKHPGPTDDGCMPIDGQVQAVDSRPPTTDGLGRGKGRGKGATSRTSRELLPLPPDWRPSEQTVQSVCTEFGLRDPEDVDRYVAAFRDACESKNYRYSSFDAAFRNCVRQDWPKFRGGKTQLSVVGQPSFPI